MGLFGKDEESSSIDSDGQNEIEKIRERLDQNETVLLVAKQGKLKPGGAITTPNTVFATNKKLIIRNPTMLGLRESVEEIPYDQITSIKLEKGMFSSTVVIRSPGLSEMSRISKSSGLIAWGRGEEGQIDALPKDKAERLVQIVKQKMEEVQKAKSQPQTQQNNDDPLKILKIRLAKGEISKEEYEEMKSTLE